MLLLKSILAFSSRSFLKSFLRSKRGDIHFIVGIILAIASFLVIALVLSNFVYSNDDALAEKACHDSISLRARTMITAEGIVSTSEIKPMPVLCKTIERKISGSREEILEQVAYSIDRCWWMFGEGRYEEILDSSEVKYFPSLFSLENTENKCFNCYTILIDQDEIEGGPIGPDEITQFMYEHNHPQFSNITYLEYIQSYGGPGRMAFTSPFIEPLGAYSISFMPKNKEGQTSWWGVGKILVGAVIVVGVVCVIATPCAVAVLSAVGLGGAAAGGTVAAGGTAAATAGTVAAGATAAGTTAAGVAGGTAAAAATTVGGYTLTASGLWIPATMAVETATVASAAGATAAGTTAAGVAGGTAAATAGTTAGTLGVVATAKTIAGGTVLASPGALMSISGVNNIIAKLYSERDMSMIIFGPLTLAQDKCGSGDVAGQ